jgi:hypothetical protein
MSYYTFQGLQITERRCNRSKSTQQTIGKALVTCVVYPGGSVDVQISCTNKPFKLESHVDVGRLLVFLGQVRAFVISVLMDPP